MPREGGPSQRFGSRAAAWLSAKSGSDVWVVAFVVVLTILAHANTFQTGFLWDDRAAVLWNRDVRPETSPWSIFAHDFWGQDITLPDSHKSYRPLTTWTYRINYMFHGYRPWSYHVGNVLLHAAVCALQYLLALRFCSTRFAAIFAAVLFAVHPIHTEPISCIVGRAEMLCAIFFCLGILAYRAKYTGLALVSGVVATLAKETGVTVFGVYAVMEALNLLVAGSASGRDKRTPLVAAAGRILLCLAFPPLVTFLHVQLHGEHVMFQWSILENDISLMPSFRDRALSYGYTHFLYVYKLFVPMHLCFDYGYACIRPVASLSDPRNLLTVIAYLLVSASAVWFLAKQQFARFTMLIMAAMPFVPAANIIFPVGTTLAERLLYTPSIGWSFLAAEAVTELVQRVAPYDATSTLTPGTTASTSKRAAKRRRMRMLHATQTPPATLAARDNHDHNTNSSSSSSSSDCRGNGHRSHTPINTPATPAAPATPATPERVASPKRRGGGTNSNGPAGSGGPAWTVVRIVCGLWLMAMLAKTVHRNTEWRNEASLFQSGMKVCPDSVKTLNNHALMIINSKVDERIPEAIELLHRAVALHPHYDSAYFNLGLCHHRQNDHNQALAAFEKAIEINPSDIRARGLAGQQAMLLYTELRNNASLLTTAKEYLDEAILRAERVGMRQPVLWHARGSVSLEEEKGAEAVEFLETAVAHNDEMWALFENDPSEAVRVSMNDERMNPAYIYNQLALAYRMSNNDEAARRVFQAGLLKAPESGELLVNLGSLLLDAHDLQSAHESIQRATRILPEEPAVWNNLGRVLEELGHRADAHRMYQKAVNMSGGTVPQMTANLQRVEQQLATPSLPNQDDKNSNGGSASHPVERAHQQAEVGAQVDPSEEVRAILDKFGIAPTPFTAYTSLPAFPDQTTLQPAQEPNADAGDAFEVEQRDVPKGGYVLGLARLEITV